MLPEFFVLLKINTSYGFDVIVHFYCRSFVSSGNHVELLQWQPIPMFVILRYVLPMFVIPIFLTFYVPTNNDHRDCTVYGVEWLGG
jgi:hypothetical protein